MFAKTLETIKDWINKVASFEISSSDSVGVKYLKVKENYLSNSET